MGIHSDYSKIQADSDFIHVAPQDVKDNMSRIHQILGGKRDFISVRKMALIRQANIKLLQGRLEQLKGENLTRAFLTMQNLRK